jgi:hypothetical protein
LLLVPLLERQVLLHQLLVPRKLPAVHRVDLGLKPASTATTTTTMVTMANKKNKKTDASSSTATVVVNRQRDPTRAPEDPTHDTKQLKQKG